jgi:vacuolar-type H+-ATPase subunit F/Vma7
VIIREIEDDGSVRHDYGAFQGISIAGKDLAETLEEIVNGKGAQAVTIHKDVLDHIADRIKRLSAELLGNGGSWA